MENKKNVEKVFLSHSQSSLNLEIKFLSQKMCYVAVAQTDIHTDMKVKIEDILSGFQNLCSVPIIWWFLNNYIIN